MDTSDCAAFNVWNTSIKMSSCLSDSINNDDATQLTTATSASNSTATTTALSHAADTETDSCRVCLVAPRDRFALVPCGHERFCESCANRVAAECGTCPVCHSFLWPPCVADADIIFLSCGFFLLSNLSGRRLDVYHTSTHGVALVRI